MENTIEQPVEQEIQAAPVETVEAPIEVAEQAEAVVEEKENTIPMSRFNNVYYEKKRLEKELAEAKANNQQQAQQHQQVQQATAAPTLEQFDYDEAKFTDALLDHKLAQRDQQKQQTKEQQKVESMVTDFRKVQSEYEIKTPDYSNLVRQAEMSGVQFNDQVAEMLMTSSAGPKVHHHLLANPQMIDEINNMSTVQSVRKFIELENKFKATAPKVSKAPAPVESIAGGATSGKSPAKMSPSEYYAHTMANRKK